VARAQNARAIADFTAPLPYGWLHAEHCIQIAGSSPLLAARTLHAGCASAASPRHAQCIETGSGVRVAHTVQHPAADDDELGGRGAALALITLNEGSVNCKQNNCA
jgi:hypothetical protein